MTPRSLIAPARLARAPVLATQSDDRLVDLVRAGHESAFETIVARYRAPLLRYAERFLPRDRAEDAVQQAFVRAFDALPRDDAELNLRPWLYRIVHNTALNALRDRTLQHGDLPEDIDGVEQPDQALERRQGLRDVLGAVAALPSRQRDAIVLRELEGRSYAEIATELGVSGGAVRQLLNRARNRLRSTASALVPIGLLARLPWASSSEPVAVRVAEWTSVAGATAVATKVCATALVTGAVVGGAAVAPDDRKEQAAVPGPAATQQEQGPEAVRPAASPPVPQPGAVVGSEPRDDDRGEGSSERENRGGEDRSGEGDGRGDRDDEERRDRSGPGEDGSEVDRSGEDRSGSSGSGGTSGPGSADIDEPEPSAAGPAPGAASARSGGSGSSGSSGSESSGSGSDPSGAGSSGPGSSGAEDSGDAG